MIKQLELLRTNQITPGQFEAWLSQDLKSRLAEARAQDAKEYALLWVGVAAGYLGHWILS